MFHHRRRDYNNKINNKLSINVESDFPPPICFDKNRLLNKDEQYEKINKIVNNIEKNDKYDFCT